MGEQVTKPNCYECIHRHDNAFSAHSECHHPFVYGENFVAGLQTLATGKPNPLRIVGNAHGIKNGWFMWPICFDPVWLEQCDGFQRKEVQHENESMPVPVSESGEVPVRNANEAGGCIAELPRQASSPIGVNAQR